MDLYGRCNALEASWKWTSFSIGIGFYNDLRRHVMISARTQATLLLTARLTASPDDSTKSLDVSEWNKLARWLRAAAFGPEDLIKGNSSVILDGWVDDKISKERILALLDRGHALALSLDRWLGAGMWILGRSDPAYPERLKRRLSEHAPPILYGYGDVQLFRSGGIAIVGSRNADRNDLQLAEQLGAQCSESGHNVISGGAKGIDERAVRGSLEGSGTGILVLADSLLKNASKKQYRDAVISKDLVLLTPYSPETSFSVGNAMGRNKLIYCLADAAIAVSSSNGAGGTFTGAVENLKRGWVPLWVAPTDDLESGNPRLVELGARWLPALSELRFQKLSDQTAVAATKHSATVIRPSLFDLSPTTQNVTDTIADDPPLDQAASDQVALGDVSSDQWTVLPKATPSQLPSLYQLFLEHWRKTNEEPKKVSELAESFGLTQSQAQRWVNQAIQDGLVTKLQRPVRFQLVENTMGP